jgi:hypothetical protein
MNNDERYHKWQRWIISIMDDIQTVYFHRSMYDGLQVIVDKYEQRDKECLFFAFLQNIFIESLVMGVRRQIKKNDDSISLARLLGELINNPEIVTRERFCALWQQTDSNKDYYMARDFSVYAKYDAKHIDSSRIEEDYSELVRACDSAVHLADRRVAHKDKRGLEKDVTFEELLSALEIAGKIVKKYYFLFTAKDMELYLIPQVLPWPRPWIDLYYQKDT